jgi:hypothetical protein
MRSVVSALFIALLCACAARPPSPADLQAKRFETLPDKAVVYLYRDSPDFSDVPATFLLDGQQQGTTYQGTYHRLELAPGRHLITGFAGDGGRFGFETQPGRLYFIRQSVSRFGPFHQSYFAMVGELEGRDAVMRAELLGAR